MSLTVYEIHNHLEKKKAARSKSFEKVLEICFNKIKVATDKELFRILFDVPEYVLGLPVYNINHCTKYIMQSLSENGFMVKYFFPKTLYISWDFDEINQVDQQRTNKQIKSDTLLLPRPLTMSTQDRLLLSSQDVKFMEFKTAKTKSKDSGMGTTGFRLQNKTTKPNGKFTLTLD
jgi:hypothetical protein